MTSMTDAIYKVMRAYVAWQDTGDITAMGKESIELHDLGLTPEDSAIVTKMLTNFYQHVHNRSSTCNMTQAN